LESALIITSWTSSFPHLVKMVYFSIIRIVHL